MIQKPQSPKLKVLPGHALCAQKGLFGETRKAIFQAFASNLQAHEYCQQRGKVFKGEEKGEGEGEGEGMG